MAKPPSWNQIRSDATAFVARWSGETRENAEAQTFWNEFLAIFGVDRRRVATFEARARRTTTGGRGRIDLLWPGVLVAEHKSAGRSLAEAEQQALDYLDSVDQADFPGVVLTSDFTRLRLLDLAADRPEPVEFPLGDLAREIDRFGFIAGYKRRDFGAAAEEAANIEAAKLMGQLFEQLSKNGYDGHDASVFLTRLLFLLFGDDTGMWEKGLFAEYVQTRSSPDGSDLGAALTLLFQTLDKPDATRSKNLDELLLRFPYVNGGLFKDRIDIPSFDQQMRAELLACIAFDWGLISPAIFGSMFQAVKSKESRRVLGEHYTTEANILRLIKPLFLDGLRAELDRFRHNASRLRRLRSSLGELRLLDPACGCGNFLVVAYRELRQLELDIMIALRGLTGEQQLTLDATLGLQVTLNQFHGIEIEEWPARIAETAMFLVDHQANLALAQEFGQAPDRLPIEVTATIVHANATQTDWRQILTPGDNVLIFGNPPFVGSRMANADQRADTDRVWAGNPRRGTLDYVTNWFRLAAEFAQGTQARIGLVSTNSISQGEQPAVLWDELWRCGMGIDFAHRTFAWSSEAPGAAAVHVVIVGYSGRAKPRTRPLWFYPDPKGEGHEVSAASINPYLTDAPDVVVRSREKPLVAGVPKLAFGSMARDAGYLSKIDLPEATRILREDPVAARYLRRIRGGEELLRDIERYCLWLVEADPIDLASSPELTRRLRAVADERARSKAPSTRAAAASPSLFVQRTQPTARYLGVPRVSSETRAYLPCAFLEPSDIASDQLFTITTNSMVIFGVISSRAFTIWHRNVSGRLKSDPRLSADVTYNNFPWPTEDAAAAGAISLAARGVMEAREVYPDASLAVLYGPRSMPSELLRAHQKLDAAVLKHFGLPARADEGAIIARLFEHYSALLRAGAPR